ncbi:uncharacterized protein RJT21DRAFT_128832 [Scheffersomyces amazonensis]|uniref:uncharacterized protein n=1 Tax=Scheffersomyces amazonensis TaxID=1078765 RepID=UPI00315CB52F
MAGTLRPDRELQRFNAAKENFGNYFRFKPRSAFFNIIAMGIVPFGLAYIAYGNDGQLSLYRRFRTENVLGAEDYVPRDKDFINQLNMYHIDLLEYDNKHIL